MQTNYTIRAAQPADAAVCVPIIIDTIGSIAYTLSGSQDKQITLQVLTHFFEQPANRISYQNCLVIEVSGQIVGVLVAYHGSQTNTLDQPYIDHILHTTKQQVTITKEAQDDEYYLDTIGILPNYRGKGYGTVLIGAFEKQAAQLGYSKLALLVSQKNEGAYKLYQRLGYVADYDIIFSGYHFWHLVKWQ